MDGLRATAHQGDIGALRAQFPEVPWTSFAGWAGERLGGAGRQP